MLTREEKKTEAIKRMRLLKLSANIIKEFDKEDVLNESEHIGALYWLNDEEKKIVSDSETNHNAVVYHVIHNFTEFGELYSLLFVGEYEEEWEQEVEDLKEGYCFCYVFNKDAEWCSEFGSIGIRSNIGGLIRTC